MDYITEDFQGPLDILLKLMRHREISASEIPLTPLCLQLKQGVEKTEISFISEAGQETCQLTSIAGIKIDAIQTVDPSSPEENPFDFLLGINDFAKMKERADFLFKRQQTTLGFSSRGFKHKNITQKMIRLASLSDLQRHFEKIRSKEKQKEILTQTSKPEEGPSLEELIEETLQELKKEERIEIGLWLANCCVKTCIGRFLALLELFKQEKILLFICDTKELLWICPKTDKKAL